MKSLAWIAAVIAVVLPAGMVRAGEPAPAPPAVAAPESLALLPKDTLSFFHCSKLQALEDDLKQFGQRTGWQIGGGEHPLLDLIARRTGLTQGVDLGGSLSIGFMDPKRFRDRYTVYVIPVSDWDALLKATRGEEMSAGLYALTGTAGPRYVARKGKYAVVTSSVRTMDAVLEGDRLPSVLKAETLTRAASGGPMIFLNVHRLTGTYESEIASWFRAASGQVYHQPSALAYADMLTAYMYGIVDFLDQMDTVEAGLKFGPEGVSVDMAIRFVPGASVAQFLSSQPTAEMPLTSLTDRTLTSQVVLRMNAVGRARALNQATDFFLEKAPRPEPLPETMKDQVREAMRVFADSLGSEVIMLSAPAGPDLGVVQEVTVIELKDPEQFKKGVELLVSAWETLADQLNLYMRLQPVPDTPPIDGFPVIEYVPRLRFGVAARHVEFRDRLRMLYGPEGLVYRIVVIENHAVVATGSDLTVFRDVLARLKAKRAPETSPIFKQLQVRLPRDENVVIGLDLPLYLGQSLLRGGTPPERVGTLVPGHEMVGIGLRADGSVARGSSYWPHEQIRLARELLLKAAPELAEAPGSLFEPPAEGPPKGGTVAPAPKAPGETEAAPKKPDEPKPAKP